MLIIQNKMLIFTAHKISGSIIYYMQKRIVYHIIFWTAYVFFKTYLNFISTSLPTESQTQFNTFITMLLAQSALLLVKVPMVYCLFGITDRYLSKQWNIIKSSVSIIALFTVSIGCFILVNNLVVIGLIYQMSVETNYDLSFTSILYTFFILCFVAGIAMAIKLIRTNIRQKEAGQEIMKKKLETELRFLKAQTNPHFLFNTLNNIYALARKKSDDTADVVMKLSKLLRFMLYEAERASIPISDELKVIEDYIELEKIRYSDRLSISYTNTIDNPGQPIAPLILLPFVENAFKHGASETRFSSFINIDVQLHNGQLDFIIENSKTENTEKPSTETIGLVNVSRQLELMYPEHHLVIENEPTTFKIILKINLLKHATV